MLIIIGGMLVLYIYIYIYIYICVYKTRLASNEIFSPSNKIHCEVGRAKDLSAPLYIILDNWYSKCQNLNTFPRSFIVLVNPLASEVKWMHPSCKMWICYQPKEIMSWNIPYFVEGDKKTRGNFDACLKKAGKYIFWLNMRNTVLGWLQYV